MHIAEKSANPNADPRALIQIEEIRFTVLTSRLIRLEWSANRNFEDQTSLVFLNRRMPVPDWQKRQRDGWLEISTEHLTLKYRHSSGKFSAENLKITFELNDRKQEWRPGKANSGNLGGTVSTLDGVSGAKPLEPGLLSRDGWTLIDDSARPLFDDSEWPWVQQRTPDERQDWYFFAYGHDYRTALKDFTEVAGKIPMPPRYAFGLWWSRYWAYTDQELLQLAQDFTRYDVPLDVLVIDMDWHQTFDLRWDDGRQDQSGHHLGWSGYSWDHTLFPDPAGFLQEVKRSGLKITLNLHPASGVQPYESQYSKMARAMGIDPATKKYVPFNITDKKFAQNYFKILHHPLEKMGVDFWWLDWQQGSETDIPGLNPIWYLNYAHFTDMERRGKRRPLIFHRWGGLGNHRYQVGFSGDTVSNWKSLAFQPYFTATAANVAYGYWSHDIGGHMPGKLDPELYLRWLQFGAFSPVLRTHTTKNWQAERRIWAFPPEYSDAMRKTIELRYALIPYIYTAARQAYDSGISICRPMYYHWPQAKEAYALRQQYMFGDDLLISPVTQPVSAHNLLARKATWLPAGDWFEWSSGAKLAGDRVVTRDYAFDEIPIFVKAGAILPLQPEMQRSDEKPLDPLILLIFPGESGKARIYEDHGDSLGYRNGEFAWTTVTQKRLADSREIVISAMDGHFPGMLKKRAFEIRLVSTWPPKRVLYNDQKVRYHRKNKSLTWRYDGETATTIIYLPRVSTAESIRLTIEDDVALLQKTHLLDGVPGRLARLQRIMPLLNSLWPLEWSPEALVHAAQTGRRISLRPQTALQETTALHNCEAEIVAATQKLDVPQKEVIRTAIAHLAGEEAPAPPAWRQLTKYAKWPARTGHQALIFRDKIWLMGGRNAERYFNDIWCSDDGKTWRCVTQNAVWSARSGHACVAHEGELYLTGGRDENGLRQDVWRSDDGIKWVQLQATQIWPARAEHGCISLHGRLFILGGEGEHEKRADVWCSKDGAAWRKVTEHADWYPRSGLATLAHEGRIWIAGGQGHESFGDIWCSVDGKRWRQMTDGAEMLPRTGHALIAWDGKLWILAGRSPDWHCYLNDIWCSENGVAWQQVTDDAPWLQRHGPAVLQLNDTLFMLGGKASIHTLTGKEIRYLNDIWIWDLRQTA